MAVFQANEAAVTAILKEVYPGAITDQLNNEVGPWAVMEKQTVKLAQGQAIIEPLHVGRNQGIGSRSDTGRLPDAGRQRHLEASVKMSTTYIIGEFTGRVVRGTYTDEAAFANVMENEMTGSLTDFANDAARQVSTGHGKLAKVNGAVTAAAVITVDSLLNLGLNQRIAIYNGATEQTTAQNVEANTGGVTITAINRATSQITVDANVTVSDGAFIYRYGNFDGTTVLETEGLETIITNTGTYFGINRANEPEAQANVVDFNAVSDANFEDKMQEAADQVHIYGGETVDLWYLDFATRRRYLKQLQSLRRYPVESSSQPRSLPGGATESNDLRRGLSEGLSFNGSPAIASRRIAPKTIFGLVLKHWVAYEQSDVEWLMNGDSVLHSLVSSGKDAYRFGAFKDMQVFCRKPNSQVKCINTTA